MNAMELAQGLWPSILAAHGLDTSLLDGKHHACPVCREGKDRFRWISSDKGGRYVCNQCKPKTGDGMELLQHFTGKAFKELAKEIELEPGQYQEVKPARKKNPLKALELLASGCELIGTDPVSKYLASRGLRKPKNSVRYHPRWNYYENGEKKGSYPVMVARILNHRGERESYQVTYLDQVGNKADVPNPKKTLPPVNTITGCGVYIGDVSGTMLIAEGVETVLAGQQLFRLPGIAAISAHGMESIILPEQIKNVVVLADNDKSFTGQKAAYTLASRLKREGRHVDVKLPPALGEDFVDVLNK